MNGNFSTLDNQLANLLIRISGEANENFGLAVKMVSQQIGQGHICLDLSDLAGRQPDDGSEAALPSLEEWQEILLASGVVGRPGEYTPLILDSPLLYLQRYYQYEKDTAESVKARTAMRRDDLIPEMVGTTVRRLFKETGDAGINWQQIAALAAVSRGITIISGGPGTGKTTTVAAILALCLEVESRHDMRIMLAAPTGKAAARLQEAIEDAKARLDCSESDNHLARNPSTDLPPCDPGPQAPRRQLGRTQACRWHDVGFGQAT